MAAIDDYLRELTHQLLRRGYRRKRAVREAEDHLREAAAVHEEAGLSHDDAERLAVEAFGSTEAVAAAFVEEGSGQGQVLKFMRRKEADMVEVKLVGVRIQNESREAMNVPRIEIKEAPEALRENPLMLFQEAEGERQLPIWIGLFEATAIGFHLDGKRPPRPLTHDLAKDLLEALGSRVERVIITERREQTYYATIQLTTSAGDKVEISARPSDAVALAIRFNAPIFMNEELLEEAA